MERSDVPFPYFVKDKLREAAKAVRVHMESAAHNSAQLALAMVKSHHPEADIRATTKGLAESDEAGNKIDHAAIWKIVAP